MAQLYFKELIKSGLIFLDKQAGYHIVGVVITWLMLT